MKRLLLALIATLCSLTALADGEYGLYILSEGGASTEPTTFSVSEIQKITFENGNVVVKQTTGESSTFSMSSISRMYFGELVTGIREVSSEGIWDGKSIKVLGDSKVEVFTTSGVAVSQGEYTNGESVNLEHLPQGVYIVKVGGRSVKIAK